MTDDDTDALPTTGSSDHRELTPPTDPIEVLRREITRAHYEDRGTGVESPFIHTLDRTSIAAQAMAGILSRVDGKLPIQTGDIDRFVAGAASLAVKAADALIKELRHQELSRNNRSESP